MKTSSIISDLNKKLICRLESDDGLSDADREDLIQFKRQLTTILEDDSLSESTQKSKVRDLLSRYSHIHDAAQAEIDSRNQSDTPDDKDKEHFMSDVGDALDLGDKLMATVLEKTGAKGAIDKGFDKVGKAASGSKEKVGKLLNKLFRRHESDDSYLLIKNEDYSRLTMSIDSENMTKYRYYVRYNRQTSASKILSSDYEEGILLTNLPKLDATNYFMNTYNTTDVKLDWIQVDRVGYMVTKVLIDPNKIIIRS